MELSVHSIRAAITLNGKCQYLWIDVNINWYASLSLYLIPCVVTETWPNIPGGIWSEVIILVNSLHSSFLACKKNSYVYYCWKVVKESAFHFWHLNVSCGIYCHCSDRQLVLIKNINCKNYNTFWYVIILFWYKKNV